MIQSDSTQAVPQPIAPRPHRFVRRLCALFATAAAIVVLSLLTDLLPTGFLPAARPLVSEAINGGLAATVLCALLAALTGLAGSLALTSARYHKLLSRFDAGIAARQGQALIVPLGAIAVCSAAALLWPREAAAAPPAANANLVAACVFVLAFVSLVAERSMLAFPAAQLPEAPSLRRLLLLTTLLLVAAACVELGRGSEMTWLRWVSLFLI